MPERPVLGVVDPPQDGSPSWDEVEQREGLPEIPIPAVPVHVDGPVQVQHLPPRTSVMRTLTVDNVTPTELLSKDLRRYRAIIVAYSANIVVGLTTVDCLASPGGGPANGATLPANQQIILYGSSRVFVASKTGTPAQVSIIAESWAD